MPLIVQERLSCGRHRPQRGGGSQPRAPADVAAPSAQAQAQPALVRTLTHCRYHGCPLQRLRRTMPAKRSTIPTPTSPADWKTIEAAAKVELARRTARAHQQILEVLTTHGHLLSEAQRRSLNKRLQRAGS